MRIRSNARKVGHCGSFPVESLNLPRLYIPFQAMTSRKFTTKDRMRGKEREFETTPLHLIVALIMRPWPAGET